MSAAWARKSVEVNHALTGSQPVQTVNELRQRIWRRVSPLRSRPGPREREVGNAAPGQMRELPQVSLSRSRTRLSRSALFLIVGGTLLTTKVDESDSYSNVAGAGRKELTATTAATTSGTATTVAIETRKGPKKGRRGDGTKWGAFPGIDSRLTFSDFLEQFLEADCELDVFMAWTSPSWSYTVRHQRGLESLLHFHPRACVVVFSETVEWDFMRRFVKKGYRVAVVRPNLLLMNAPAEEFTWVWLTWRKIDLFPLHYSELLRLAALRKYGGVYLDSDIVVLRPLNSLRNTIGEEVLADGATRLNRAVMAFDKGSSFIWDCLEEYTATYNDTLVEWNGADLLQRLVATKSYGGDELAVLPPMSFYPVASSNISSYMSSQDETLMQQILDKSYTFHLWNRATYALVPDSQSLVGRLLARHCIWCQDLL